MAQTPTAAQLRTAIAQLDAIEGDTGPDGDRTACVVVAIYLESLLERREAREGGCSVRYLRRIRAEQVQA